MRGRLASFLLAALRTERSTDTTTDTTTELISTMPKVNTADLSCFNIRADARKSAKAFNSAWGASDKAPYFLKKAKMVGTGKERRPATVTDKNGITKVVARRTNRCLRRHAMRALLSAAIYDSAYTLEIENAIMGIEASGEMARAPGMYTISKGAAMLFEHALSAYAQTVFHTASNIVDNAAVHMKVTTGAMKAATEIINTSLTRASSTSPFIFHANSYKKTTKKPKKCAGKTKEAPQEDQEEA